MPTRGLPCIERSGRGRCNARPLSPIGLLLGSAPRRRNIQQSARLENRWVVPRAKNHPRGRNQSPSTPPFPTRLHPGAPSRLPPSPPADRRRLATPPSPSPTTPVAASATLAAMLMHPDAAPLCSSSSIGSLPRRHLLPRFAPPERNYYPFNDVQFELRC